MLERARHQQLVVGGHVGDLSRVAGGVFIGAADGDDRHMGTRERPRDGGIVVVRDDAVALPLVDAVEAKAEVLLQEQVPGHARLLHIVTDADEDLAVIDLAGVEQQGHAQDCGAAGPVGPARGRAFGHGRPILAHCADCCDAERNFISHARQFRKLPRRHAR